MHATATTEARAATAIDRRLAHLRDLAQGDPAVAQEETWAWFVEAGRRIQKDRDAALRELNDLFRAGTPSEGIQGPTEGTLVGFGLQPAFDRLIATITTAWLPWAGKRFDSAAGRGDNFLVRSARWPAKLLWPRYETRPLGDARAAFEFETRVEAGKVDPDRDVLVIDYSVVDSNPRLVIRQIRDELVEIVPGANLGKILWRSGDSYSLIGYFALRSEIV